MSRLPSLYEPLLDAREVIQTYIGSEVLVDDWRETLESASRRLAAAAAGDKGPSIRDLAAELQDLTETGLSSRRPTVERVAMQLGELVSEVRVPGIPKPEDDDWGFQAATSS